jgi:hypothetical protein
MPSSFLRRWSYDEMVPSLLYFDSITFLMDDIEPRFISAQPISELHDRPVALHSPAELKGVPDEQFVDGLTAEQHRYYWPMRDLMRDGVIVITSMDLSMVPPEELAPLHEAFRDHQHPKHRVAVDFRSSAVAYFDLMAPTPSGATEDEKARDVYRWFRDALLRSAGWRPALLHPTSFIAFKAALELFPALYEIHARGRFVSGSTSPISSMFALKSPQTF